MSCTSASGLYFIVLNCNRDENIEMYTEMSSNSCKPTFNEDEALYAAIDDL